MSIQSLLSIFTTHTKTGAGTSLSWLGKLSVEELKKADNIIFNMREAGLSGIRTAGDLISAYDEARGGFDHNGAGWLVMHLTENIEALLDLGYQIKAEFNARGLDIEGNPIKGVRRG